MAGQVLYLDHLLLNRGKRRLDRRFLCTVFITAAATAARCLVHSFVHFVHLLCIPGVDIIFLSLREFPCVLLVVKLTKEALLSAGEHLIDILEQLLPLLVGLVRRQNDRVVLYVQGRTHLFVELSLQLYLISAQLVEDLRVLLLLLLRLRLIQKMKSLSEGFLVFKQSQLGHVYCHQAHHVLVRIEI